jgi:hypothetical protein
MRIQKLNRILKALGVDKKTPSAEEIVKEVSVTGYNVLADHNYYKNTKPLRERSYFLSVKRGVLK